MPLNAQDIVDLAKATMADRLWIDDYQCPWCDHVYTAQKSKECPKCGGPISTKLLWPKR